ncbi:MAG: hypothetical protein QOG10_6028, partial [Kribbellaceae bacterium]|nr:hypothetical protein [Kribbellaceae bacterium]
MCPAATAAVAVNRRFLLRRKVSMLADW